MIVVFAVMMPAVMLALLFFLADIESRHLTQRTRVAEHPSVATTEGAAGATA